MTKQRACANSLEMLRSIHDQLVQLHGLTQAVEELSFHVETECTPASNGLAALMRHLTEVANRVTQEFEEFVCQSARK